MRFSLVALLPVVISLTTFVAAHTDHTLEAREILDGLHARSIEKAYFDNLERRELLSEFTTRELVSELYERAGGSGNNAATFTCPYCGSTFPTAPQASACAKTHNVNINQRKARK